MDRKRPLPEQHEPPRKTARVEDQRTDDTVVESPVAMPIRAHAPLSEASQPITSTQSEDPTTAEDAKSDSGQTETQSCSELGTEGGSDSGLPFSNAEWNDVTSSEESEEESGHEFADQVAYSTLEDQPSAHSANFRRFTAIQLIHRRLGSGIDEYLDDRLQPNEVVHGAYVPRPPENWKGVLLKALAKLVWWRVTKEMVNNKLLAIVTARMQREKKEGIRFMAVREKEVYEALNHFREMGCVQETPDGEDVDSD